MVSGPTFYPLKKFIYEHYYPGCKAIARDTPGNTSNPGSKEFAVFPNCLAVETYVRSLPLPQRNLYEICLYSSELSIRNCAVKLFVDVDVTGEEWSDYIKEVFVHKLTMQFADIVESLYNIDYDYRNIRLLDSCGVIEKESGKVFKTSFHVIFDGVHFANIEKLRTFITHYFPELLQFTGVDKAVYNNGQLFRLPLCTKKGRNLPLRFCDDYEDDFQSCMVCSISSTSVHLAVDKKTLKKPLHSVIPINLDSRTYFHISKVL